MSPPALVRGPFHTSVVPVSSILQAFRTIRLPVVHKARPSVPCSSSYRWSAERDGRGRRKRESLFDNGEPDTTANVEESDVSVLAEGSSQGVSDTMNGYDSLWSVDDHASAAQGTSGSSNSGGPEASSSDPSHGLWDEWAHTSPTPGQGDAFGWEAPSWAGAHSSPADSPRERDAPHPAQPRNGSSNSSSAEAHPGWDPSAHHAYGGARWEAHQQQDGGAGMGEEGDSAQIPSGQEGGGGPAPGFGGEMGGFGGRYGGERYSSSYQPGSSPPDIATLNPDELERVMPVIPFSQQASFFNKGAVESVQRWGASLAVTVLLSKVVVLAATSLTWPLWWPWAMAANKNLALRKQFKYAGLWRTQLLEVEITGRPKPLFGEGAGSGGRGLGAGSSTMRMAKFVVGDPGGALTEMTLPYDSRYELVGEGEQAELLVLSNSPGFESFKAVKDVYLPSCGLWLSEYPYADRTAFLEVSLDIEQEALQEEQAAQQGQQGSGPGPGGGGYYTRY